MYLLFQFKTIINNNITDTDKIKTDLKSINDLINTDHENNNNIFNNIKNKLEQINNIYNDLNNKNNSDHLLFDKKIFDIIIDKTSNWNYGNPLPKYTDFEHWPTRMAFIDPLDTFRPPEIMNHNAFGIKVTSADTISESWIILSLENNMLYSRIKNISDEMSDWKSIITKS